MSLDATSSGIQIMAALSGCKKTAQLTNMIDPTKRYDIYAEIMNAMNAKLSKPVPRNIVKQVAMTHFYNSKATPKALLSATELRVFYDVITGLLPGAETIMESINDCWNYQADHHKWVMPDSHTVYIPVVEGINAIYTDHELGDIPLRYYHQTSSKNFRSLCPNVIHSIDGYIAREMIRRCDFQLSHVHDCFVFNPNHLEKVIQTYKLIMSEIAKGDIFLDILKQITGDNTLTLTKHSSDLHIDILKSSYMLS
jgi:DNA-directed RNA polymerase